MTDLSQQQQQQQQEYLYYPPSPDRQVDGPFASPVSLHKGRGGSNTMAYSGAYATVGSSGSDANRALLRHADSVNDTAGSTIYARPSASPYMSSTAMGSPAAAHGYMLSDHPASSLSSAEA